MHGLFRVELIAATLEGPRNRTPSTSTNTNTTHARNKANNNSSSGTGRGGADKAGKRGRKKVTHKEVNMDADDEEGDENDEGRNYDLHDHQQQPMDEENKEENAHLDAHHTHRNIASSSGLARPVQHVGGPRLNDRRIDLDADFDGDHLLPPRPSSSHSHSSVSTSTGIATKRKMGQNYDPQFDEPDDGRITSSLYTHPVRGAISTNAPTPTVTVRSPIRNNPNNPNNTNNMNNSFSSTSRYPSSSTGQYSSTENSPYNHNTTTTHTTTTNKGKGKGGEKKGAHMSRMLLRDDD